MNQNVVLVGPMGAGKSTIGKLLSSRLGFNFVDTDSLIEERTGADIPWIFEIEGEAGFRQRETAILRELLDVHKTVVATGGGIVVTPENLSILKSLGRVIYLSASIEHLFDRTSKDRKRPLLQVSDPKEKLTQLVSQRDPIYRDVADQIVVTSDQPTKYVVNQIVQDL